MPFAELPSETIIRILSHLEMVCRRFRGLVASDSYLQYVLELELCGYSLPSRPRLDLKYLEKLEAVREHRRKWEVLGSIQPTLIQFPVAAQASSGEFVDGVYARGLLDQLNDPWGHAADTTRAIEFYQLPSSNTQSGLRTWTHAHLGEGVIKFAIQPAQDLLVLVHLNVQLTNQFDHINSATYTIRLRTITTNEPHPAVLGNAELQFEIQTKRPNFFTLLNRSAKTLFIHISGSFLGIVFRSGSSEVRTHLVVWNWVLGRRVAHLSIRGGIHTSPRFAFLSDGYFVVPRNAGYMNVLTGIIVKNQGASNHLDVYRLPPPGDGSSQEAYHIASFVVPAPKNERSTSSLELFGPSTLVPSKYLCAPSNSRPALYDPAPNQHLLSIYNEPSLWTADSVESTFSDGALYFSAQLLLAHLARLVGSNPVHDCQVTIPWRDWGGRTSWIDMDTKWFSPHAFSHEQRLLVLSGYLTAAIHKGLYPISILDFGRQNPSARKTGGCETGVHVHVPSDCPIMDEGLCMGNGDLDGRKVSENEQTSQFLSGKTKARRTYLRTGANLQLPDYRRLESHWAPLVGNEHVVIQVTLTGSGAGKGILVYSL